MNVRTESTCDLVPDTVPDLSASGADIQEILILAMKIHNITHFFLYKKIEVLILIKSITKQCNHWQLKEDIFGFI